MAETALTGRILRYLASEGFYAWKVHGGPYSQRGMPDIMACRDGRLYCFEVKVQGNKATKLQRKRLAQFAAAGAVCGVVYSLEEVQALIRAAEAKSSGPREIV